MNTSSCCGITLVEVITLYEYIVKPGDTLHKISDYYGVSPEFLLATNTRLRIEPGQRVIVPISNYFERTRYSSYYAEERNPWT